MEIIRNKSKHYLPEDDKDLPLFCHIFNGAYEVDEKTFNKNEFLFALHGVPTYSIFDEGYIKPTHYKTADDCPDVKMHTECPKRYIQWTEWAEKKVKTHDQRECPTCGYYAIWEEKLI